MGDQVNAYNTMTPPSGDAQKDQPPFHSQLDDMSHSRVKTSPQAGGNIESQPFDLRQMANALPANSEQAAYGARRPSAQYNIPTSAGMAAPSSYAYGQPVPHYVQQTPDPRAFGRLQQQQHYPPQHVMSQYQYSNRPQQPAMQTQPQFARVDNYAYAMNQQGYSPVDMRFPQPQFPMGYGPPGGYADIGKGHSYRTWKHPADAVYQAHHARPISESVNIPSFPRGPPRKPKQSGHALWVGNLPPAATVTDLKDHFSRDATNDIQSLFLISKSNCAFVNYRTEAACVAAMNRFHDSRFHGVRLVCRLRRGATTTTTNTNAEDAKTNGDSSSAPKPLTNGVTADEPSDPIIVGGPPTEKTSQTDTKPTQTSSPAARVPEKFFVVKSLTLQDLEASVRNGIWATQSHNESILNEAFKAADNVYLVFSANKSGEYFGYARMASPITGDAVPVGSTPAPQPSTPSDGPQSIPTPATETAPRGRIIDDSARGTIFWEAELSEEEDEASSPSKDLEENSSGQDLGRPFNIEWISTARLPFYRTRGLRNPWNANREVKIARDGTELEPSVGKRLVQMFHRPPQMVASPMSMQQQGGVPYQMA